MQLQALDLQLLRFYLSMAGKGLRRIGGVITNPPPQNVLVDIQIPAACATLTPRSLISRTASILNSRPNFLRFRIPLLRRPLDPPNIPANTSRS